MHFLSVLSMKNRALIALVTIVAAFFGVVAVSGLKQELAPSLELGQISVVTTYTGASPAIVDNDVSTPIENSVQGIAGIDTTSSTSTTGQSLVAISFDYGTNLTNAEQKVDQAINGISGTLPDGLTPQVVSGSIDDLPVIQIAATGNSLSTMAADLDNGISDDIGDLDGVRSADVSGERGERVTIVPKQGKLDDAGLTSSSITSALQASGDLVASGSITQDGKTLTVQAGGKLESLADIRSIAIVPSSSSSSSSASASASSSSSAAAAAAATGATATPKVSVQTIGDVATVTRTQNPQASISRVNGKSAVTISVTKLPDANTVDVSKVVRAALPGLVDQMGDGTKLTVVYDQAPYVQDSIKSLAEEGLLGLLFAIIVILIFLLSIRSTIVTAISIPTSVLLTFIGMQAAGYSLNILTLGALTIAIGRVVDDSIVVIENINRHLESGEDRQTAILAAVREVAGAVTASTLTTVAVFLPLAFVSDVTGELFRPFALTVSMALVASLLVALTIVPVLAYWFLRPKTRARAASDAASATGDDELDHPTRLQRGYLPIIRWTVRKPLVTIGIALLVLIGTGALVPQLQTNFLGSSGQNSLSITQDLPVGTSLKSLDRAATAAETVLRETKGIQTVQLTIGSSGSALQDAFSGSASSSVSYSITTDENADQDALATTVKKSLDRLRDAGDFTISATTGFGTSNDIEIDLSSHSDADLRTASDRIVAALKKNDAFSQVDDNLSNTLPYIAVEVKRTAAAKAGYTELALSDIVASNVQPSQVGTVSIDDTNLDIYLDSKNPPTTRQQLRDLKVATPTGTVKLSKLATVKIVNGPASITSEEGSRTATIDATPAGNGLTAANAAVTSVLANTHLPSGVSADLGGSSSQQSTAFSQLLLAMLAAILIVYIIMVATFRSLLQPLLLLVSVPFAATGALLLQLISGIPLGVASIVGLLMLVGIVVTNAIVLVDLVNQYRRRGMPVAEALIHGASRRLRPILMTALATIFALIPMAMGLTGKGFISQPLAIVVIGGLVSSTVLTLVVLPVLYSLVEGWRERRHERRTGTTAPVIEPEHHAAHGA